MIECGRFEGVSNDELLQRFVHAQDHTAFAALLQRHGPLVLRVCRQVLQDSHEAEDAFQATFLVLARKAATIRRNESLPGWLYRVGYRLAVKIRCGKARQRASEQNRLHQTGPGSRSAAEPWCDLREVIHDEVDALSTKYRLPVVLCYLQGKSNEEAARELGWPIGTVKIRLLRARNLLRGRLTRRGLAFGASLLALAFADDTVSAALDQATLDAVRRLGPVREPIPAGSLVRGATVLAGLFLVWASVTFLILFPRPASGPAPLLVPRNDTARGGQPLPEDILSGGEQEPPSRDLPGDEGVPRFLVVRG
jgi:RNA polymerase sigma factor (sigma-70 family)